MSTFKWDHDGTVHSINVSIPQILARRFESRDRYSSLDYSVYILSQSDKHVIQNILDYFRTIRRRNHLSSVDFVNLVASFGQKLTYIPEEIEYPKYPVETLVDGGGDCEDKAILISKLLHQMGYNTALFFLPKHCALGVEMRNITGSHVIYEGCKYFFLEPSPNWKVGQIPDKYKGENIEVFKVESKPIITMTFKVSYTDQDAKFSIKVTNIGDRPSFNLLVRSALDPEDGYIYNSQEKTISRIEPSETVEISLSNKMMNEPRFKFQVACLDQGQLLVRRYTDWV